jgi:3'-phosphoadenosine 5'-phosphosulfate sulfotransferase (PAPS reductase)/FAD synthetase
MIHGPCGHYNLKCVCMNADKCAKEFPKSFSSQTDTNVNGYSPNIRRDNGIHFLKTLNVIDQFNKKTKIELKINQRIF